MVRRSRSWEEGLAEDLKDPEFTRHFIYAGVNDENIPIQTVLAKVIKCLGVKKFAKKVKMSSPNLLRVINPSHNATLQTLERLLKPFALKVSVGPIQAMPEPQYDFSGGVRGKYARRYAQGTNIVMLEPDVAKNFPDSRSVNKALRKLSQFIRHRAKGAHLV